MSTSNVVEWREDWFDSSIPFVYYPLSLTDSESRGALKVPLCKTWADKYSSVEVMKDALKRMSFVIFDRLIQKKDDMINPYSFAIIKNSDRVLARSEKENPIYCIGCAEKVMSDFDKTNHVLGTRITLLGFISETSKPIAYGVKTAKYQKIHGVRIDESFLAILIKSLTLNLASILNPQEMIESPTITTISRIDPTSYVYVFGWDPPTNENMGDLIKMSIGKLVMDRIDLLCALHEGRIVGVKPLIDKKDNLAARASIHLLVMLMCWSPELCEWYINAEDFLLSKRLALLLDYEDMLITMEAARIRTEVENTNFLDDAEKMIREVQERRLRTALTYARKMGSLPNSLRELASRAVIVINSKIKM